HTRWPRDWSSDVCSSDLLGRSKQKDDILAHTRYLNGHVLYPYRRLDDAVRMDAQNYDPNLGTPLYDETVVMLGTVLAKTRKFEEIGRASCRERVERRGGE